MDPEECLEKIRIAFVEHAWDDLQNEVAKMLRFILDGGKLPPPTEGQSGAPILMADSYAERRRITSRYNAAKRLVNQKET